MLLNGVVVGCPIPVIIGDRLAVILLFFVEAVVVVVNRGHPDSRNTEALQVRQMIDDALEVAAVIKTGLVPIQETPRDRRVIVGWIAIGETVWHQEVDDVVRGEATKVVGPGQKWRDSKRNSRGSAGCCQIEWEIARWYVRRD